MTDSSKAADNKSGDYSNSKLLDMSSMEDDELKASHYLLWATAFSLFAFLIWASFFNLDEISRAQGKVIPFSREQDVQSLDTGVLSEMLVREGDQVIKNQVLLRIDDTRSGSSYREAKEKWLSLTALVTRLRAEAYGTELIFPNELNEYPALAARETQAYKNRKQALDEQISAMKRSLTSLQAEIRITGPLVKEGVVSKVELLRLQRQLADQQAQVAERQNRYLTDATNDLVRADAELTQTRENVLGRKDVLNKTVIRAPMNGIVKNIQTTTIGAVIQAGQTILEIVPVDDDMLIEAYIKPSEVAFLKVGQPAIVKLSAYEFNRYGSLEGVLEHVSPDTLPDESRQKRTNTNNVDLGTGYYRILIRIIDKNKERQGMVMTPLPGMSATIEIRTGQKTVMEYLFRPLQSVRQALRER
jgi:adhesin transport system membrane fusion protein